MAVLLHSDASGKLAYEWQPQGSAQTMSDSSNDDGYSYLALLERRCGYRGWLRYHFFEGDLYVKFIDGVLLAKSNGSSLRRRTLVGQ